MWKMNGETHREYGDRFILNNIKYQVVGIDSTRNEIECVTIPFDGDYYWFKEVGDSLIRGEKNVL